jgi:hypothetical protein
MTNDGPTPAASLHGLRSHLPWLWALLPVLVGFCLCEVLYQFALDPNLWQPWRNSPSAKLWTSTSSPQWPFFTDLTTTLDHFRVADQGVDPLSDPKSTYAYPRAFLFLRHLHAQDLPSALVGSLQAGIWMIAVIFVLRPRSFFRAVLTTAVFFAPPFVLGLEQGNVDMMLFVLVLLAAVGWSRSGNAWSRLWPIVLILFAAFLKMYPVFVLAGGAWADRGRRRLTWVAAMAVVGTYWALHAEEIRLVMSKFELGYGSSWGCLLIFSHGFPYNIPHLWQLAVATYAGAFLLTVALGALSARHFHDCTVPRREWTFYWFGAAICSGCFLTTNYDYRWVHALLTIPLLLRVVRMKRVLPVLWAGLTLLALAVSLSFPLDLHPLHKPFMIVQWANWAFVLLLAFGFTAMRSHHLEVEVNETAAAAPARDAVVGL